MDIKGIKDYLGDSWKAVTELLEASLKSDISLLDATNRKILSTPGKQLRPVICLLVARLCGNGKVSRSSIRCAAASELLHNATLLHDDVADDSYSRRGVPTVMSLLGGRSSVLLGDYWLVKAIDNILEAGTEGDRLIRVFAKTLSDLAEGEILQLEKSATCDTVEEDYLRIIFSKTASLFEATAVSAAISEGASPESTEAVRAYAYNLGMAFQIKDDILDYSGDERIGKPVGIDLQEQKITLPLLGAFLNAGPEAENAMRRKVADIHLHPEYADEIREFIRENRGMEYAGKRLSYYVEKAVSSLDRFGPGEDRSLLKSIALYVAERNS